MKTVYYVETLYCCECLTDHSLFVGGSSERPARCPKCGGTLLTEFKNLSKAKQMEIKHEGKYLVTYETGRLETSTHTAEYHNLEDVALDMFNRWKGYRGDLRIVGIHLIKEIEIDKEIIDFIKDELKVLTSDAKATARLNKEIAAKGEI